MRMAGEFDRVLSSYPCLCHILSVRSNALSTSAISVWELDVLSERGYILTKKVVYRRRRSLQVSCCYFLSKTNIFLFKKVCVKWQSEAARCCFVFSEQELSVGAKVFVWVESGSRTGVETSEAWKKPLGRTEFSHGWSFWRRGPW